MALMYDVSIKTVEIPFKGETVVGNLFTPKNVSEPCAALVFLGPLTSVKEQVPGHYAKAMAERGFITLAIDNRYFGESSGMPRQYEHPGHKVEDIKGALDWLCQDGVVNDGVVNDGVVNDGVVNSVADGSLDCSIDKERLGAVGICAGAGYMSGAVAGDPRIKAFGGVAGFYHDVEQQKAWMGDGFDKAIDAAKALREEYEKTGKVTEIPAVGKEGDVAMPLEEAFEYYGTARGEHPNYVNAFNVMSREYTLPWHARGYASQITVPTLMIHSEKALTPALARSFYGDLGGEKKEIWMESKGQIDFYDDPALINPVADALAEHFRSVFA